MSSKLSFACGPSYKGEHWSVEQLSKAIVGTSHLLPQSLERINILRTLIKDKLNIPDSFELLLVNGSCTGAMSCLLQNLAYKRKILALVWDGFANDWADDAKFFQADVERIEFDCTQSKNLFNHQHTLEQDILFTWTSTISGIRPNALEFLSTSGLKFCDATACVGIEPLPWESLDAIGFSLQKGLGGEAGLGVCVLSPKAQKILQTTTHYVLKLFRIRNLLTYNNTTNTISMLIVEDAIEQLKRIENMNQHYQKAAENNEFVRKYIENSTIFKPIIHPDYQSNSVFCFMNQIESHNTRDRIKEVTITADLPELTGHTRFQPCYRIWTGPWLNTTHLKQGLDQLTKAYLDLL